VTVGDRLLGFLINAWNERRDQLIAAFADLRPNIVLVEVVTMIPEGFLPGHNMKIVGIHQRAVDVEEMRLDSVSIRPETSLTSGSPSADTDVR